MVCHVIVGGVSVDWYILILVISDRDQGSFTVCKIQCQHRVSSSLEQLHKMQTKGLSFLHQFNSEVAPPRRDSHVSCFVFVLII